MSNIFGPASYDYGDVVVGFPVEATFTFSVDFGQVQDALGITGPDAADFVVTQPLTPNPVSVAGGGTGTVKVTFTPSNLGAKSATLTLNTDAENSPWNVPMTGNGTVPGPGSGTLTAAYQTTDDFGSVKIGDTSAPLNVILSNNSGADVVVNNLADNGDFHLSGPPATPFTLLANGASAPVTVSMVFTPTVVGLRVQADALAITHTGFNTPLNVEFRGTGTFITAAFTVLSGPLVPLFALFSPSVVRQGDPDDLNCEEPASIKRVYDWAMAQVEKTLMRVILRYEDLGAFTYTVTAVMPQRPTVVSAPVTSGTGTGKVANSYADLIATDDLIEIEISRAADSGPIVINEIDHKVEHAGEYVERT